MPFTLELPRDLFAQTPRTLLSSSEWEVATQRYRTGPESLTIRNSRGFVEVLPYQGQIIWDAHFDGQSLRMDSMFDEPRSVAEIIGTYGCFAFHAGLLAAGCPSPSDTHALHGEFPCAPMDRAEVVISEEAVTVRSHYEYVMGFGHHYRATASVTLHAGSALFDIGLEVENASAYAPMPLQYMCHLNPRFLTGGVMEQTLPEGAFALRETVPAHVTPTPEWERINEKIRAGEIEPDSLVGAEVFDPEIVYFADGLAQHGERARFTLSNSDEFTFVTEFDTAQFPVATRWILANPDQQVAAYVIPGTSRPEGFLAAQEAGTLIMLGAGERRRFSVRTGLLAAGEQEGEGS